MAFRHRGILLWRGCINSRIALVITDKEKNIQIKKLGVGLLELRADLFKKLDPTYVVDQIKHRKLLKIPLLLTVRNQKKEGAVRVFSDDKKWEIITAALPLVDMVDIELSSPLLKKTLTVARKLGKMVIVSSHYLQGMPRELGTILKKSLSTRADIVKIAARANSFDDVMTTMSLGPLGAISRVILPAAGSRYTYTFLNKPTASGQVDVTTLKSHLKVYYPS
jgi:3-dehydroquinate dehydratase I